MITLAAADYIAGVADVSSKVTITLFGMEYNSADTPAEDYKRLFSGQITNSAASLYAAPASHQAFIRSMAVVNTDTVVHTFQLFAGGTTAPFAITPVITLQPGGYSSYEDGLGWQTFSKYGAVLQTPYMTVPSLDNWGTAGSIGATHDRNLVTETNTTLITTGQVYMQAIYLYAGQVVSALRIWAATTASATQTATNAGLYDSAGNRLATGTDGASVVWAANTLRSFTMKSPYTVPTTGLYYVAVSTVATTMNTFKGITARVDGAIALASPPISGISATAYVSGDMPATLAVPAGKVLTSMYAEVA